MNRYVAANTFAAGLKAQPAVRNRGLSVETGVALQAELAAFAANQEHAIGGAMRVVAGNAAFDFYCRMLVDKRPALFHVAIHAGFEPRLGQAGKIFRAVWAMTIRTFDQSFRDAMMVRQREFGLDGEVAREAKRRLSLFEQAVVEPASFFTNLRKLEEMRLRVGRIALAVIFHFVDQMRGVALIAGDAVAGMFRVREKFLLLAGGMAREATSGIFVSRAAKSEQRMIFQSFRGGGIVTMSSLNGIGVPLGWAVAGFAAANVVFARKNQLGVSGFAVFRGDFLVAALARFRAGKISCRSIKFRSAAGD